MIFAVWVGNKRIYSRLTHTHQNLFIYAKWSTHNAHLQNVFDWSKNKRKTESKKSERVSEKWNQTPCHFTSFFFLLPAQNPISFSIWCLQRKIMHLDMCLKFSVESRTRSAWLIWYALKIQWKLSNACIYFFFHIVTCVCLLLIMFWALCKTH